MHVRSVYLAQLDESIPEWSVPKGITVRRESTELRRCLEPIFMSCKEILLVESYFSPFDKKWCDVFACNTLAPPINRGTYHVDSKSTWTQHHARTEAFPEPRHFETHLKRGIRAVRHSWTVCRVLLRCSSSAGSNCLKASESMIALCSQRSGHKRSRGTRSRTAWGGQRM